MTNLNLTFRDNNNEVSTMGVPTTQMTAANHDTIVDYLGDLQLAAAAVSLGEIAAKGITHSRTHLSGDRPTDPNANREMGVRFTLVNVVNPAAKVTVTLPAPDFSFFPFTDANSEVVVSPFPTLATELDTLILALEAATKHPTVVGDMAVNKMEKIGRNL